MGYGTNYSADMYISHVNLTNIYDLELEIEDCKNDISHIREELMMHAAAGLNGVNDRDCEDNPIDKISSKHTEMKNLLNWYEETIVKLYKLELLKEDYDYKEGKFKTAEYC